MKDYGNAGKAIGVTGINSDLNARVETPVLETMCDTSSRLKRCEAGLYTLKYILFGDSSPDGDKCEPAVSPNIRIESIMARELSVNIDNLIEEIKHRLT